LSLPVRSLDIPDSVEILSTEISNLFGDLVVRFGHESMLRKFTAQQSPSMETIRIRAFVQLPARGLKVIRSDKEFEWNLRRATR
jgi:hypothetical protein